MGKSRFSCYQGIRELISILQNQHKEVCIFASERSEINVKPLVFGGKFVETWLTAELCKEPVQAIWNRDRRELVPVDEDTGPGQTRQT